MTIFTPFHLKFLLWSKIGEVLLIIIWPGLSTLSSALLLTCPCYRVTADRRSRECDTFVMVKCEGAAHPTSSQSHASLGSHPSVENILQISSTVSLSRVSPRNYCDCKFIDMSGFYLVIDCHRSRSGAEEQRHLGGSRAGNDISRKFSQYFEELLGPSSC